MINEKYLVVLFFCVGGLILLAGCGASTSNPTEQDLALAVKTEIKNPEVIMPEKEKETIEVDSTISPGYMMGKFVPAKDTAFVKIDIKYADREGMYMRKEAYEKFKEMHAAAKTDGVNLQIRSATRNFDRQKTIWEGKWNGTRLLEGKENAKKKYPVAKDRALKILEYSSMPGTSRHHWGTDIDLNSFVNSYFEKGKGLKEYEWLTANAIKYGYCQPYTLKSAERPDGYNEEKWHWSYLPISVPLTQQYQLRLNNEDIKGFDGDETTIEIDVVRKYVLGINNACKHH